MDCAAITSLAELHGRCGYFPAHLRLRPKGGFVPPQYE
ncbi:MAG: CRISPR-associated protein Csx15 [Anaerolineae bacterium]